MKLSIYHERDGMRGMRCVVRHSRTGQFFGSFETVLEADDFCERMEQSKSRARRQSRLSENQTQNLRLTP